MTNIQLPNIPAAVSALVARAEADCHINLLHLQIIVVAVAGNSKIHIDLSAKPASDSFGGQG